MSRGGRTPTTGDDQFKPRPVWFAQQLRWCSGPQGVWSWTQLLDEAEARYWAAKADRRTAA